MFFEEEYIFPGEGEENIEDVLNNIMNKPPVEQKEPSTEKPLKSKVTKDPLKKEPLTKDPLKKEELKYDDEEDEEFKEEFQAGITTEQEWRAFDGIKDEWKKSRVGMKDDINLSTMIYDPTLYKIHRHLLELDPLEKFNVILMAQISEWNKNVKSPKFNKDMIKILHNNVGKIIHISVVDPFLYILGYLCIDINNKIDPKSIETIYKMRYHSFEKSELIRSARVWEEVYLKN